jgi:adenosine kinase
MGKILVSGSTAYDHIMDFNDKFKNHIKMENIHKLSVSFFIDTMKKERGGTGLNIAYNLALLWENPLLLSSVWKDYIFSDFHTQHINLEYIYTSSESFSTSIYITNDTDGSMINAFYPWAMMDADKISVLNVQEKLEYAIVAPNKKEAMIQYTRDLNTLGVKTFFDPGQAIFSMNKSDLENAMRYANYLIANDYEFDLFLEKIGQKKEEVIENFEKVIITLWAKGSVIIDKKEEIFIPVVENKNVLDPTGAGDAYRGWLLVGLNNWKSWETAGKMWALLASLSVWSFGWQNHFIEKKDFEERFESEFGEKISL